MSDHIAAGLNDCHRARGHGAVADIDLTIHNINGQLVGVLWQRKLGTGLEICLDVESLAGCSYRRRNTESLPGNQPQTDSIQIHFGYVTSRIVLKARLRFFKLDGQCDPRLNTVQIRARFFQFNRRSLGVDDTAACRHPVDCAFFDDLRVAQAVAVHDLAGKKIGNRSDADMRMGANADAAAWLEICRPDVIEENEWAHTLPFWCR